MEKKGKEKRSVLSTVILVIAIGVFLFSGYKLYEIYAEYEKGENEYENIQKVVIKQEEKGQQEEEIEENSQFIVDFSVLMEMNPDTVGWIRFDEPAQISYPIVKGMDNDKYLKTTFEGKRNSAGAIFMDAANNSDFRDKNTFIYGHNMKNGSMFSGLRKYKNTDFCEENPYFYIYTPDGKETTYQIFAVSVIKDDSEHYRKSYVDDADFFEYLAFVKKSSRYWADMEMSVDAQIVSLSTCTNVSDDERLLVQGVKVSEEFVEQTKE